MGGLPHLSDLSVGGLLPINVSWPCQRSPFRLLPPFLPLFPRLSYLVISRARTLE